MEWIKRKELGIFFFVDCVLRACFIVIHNNSCGNSKYPGVPRPKLGQSSWGRRLTLFVVACEVLLRWVTSMNARSMRCETMECGVMFKEKKICSAMCRPVAWQGAGKSVSPTRLHYLAFLNANSWFCKNWENRFDLLYNNPVKNRSLPWTVYRVFRETMSEKKVSF